MRPWNGSKASPGKEFMLESGILGSDQIFLIGISNVRTVLQKHYFDISLKYELTHAIPIKIMSTAFCSLYTDKNQCYSLFCVCVLNYPWVKLLLWIIFIQIATLNLYDSGKNLTHTAIVAFFDDQYLFKLKSVLEHMKISKDVCI